MDGESIDIELSLKKLDEFFAEPAADPFNPQSRYVSGIDEVAGQIRLRRHDLRNPSRLIVRLPRTEINPDVQPDLLAALNRYCTAKIFENQQIINELRVGSRREAVSAFVIAAVLILLSILSVMLIPPLQAVSGSISGFIGIAVWVIFWDPIYNYVYAWRPNRLDIRVFENLRNAEVIVKSDPVT